MPQRVVLPTSIDPAGVVELLEAAARRGRLAGWTAAPNGQAGEIGRIADFGTPFESELIVRATSLDQSGRQSDLTLTFDRRIKPRVPLIVLVSLIATVWPGVVLTDSLLRTYWTSYDFQTWMWYVPLTAPFVPLAMRSALKRSRASAVPAAGELIAKVAEITGGRLEP